MVVQRFSIHHQSVEDFRIKRPNFNVANFFAIAKSLMQKGQFRNDLRNKKLPNKQKRREMLIKCISSGQKTPKKTSFNQNVETKKIQPKFFCFVVTGKDENLE